MKFWLYYADVGGGHHAAAQALERAIAQKLQTDSSTKLINATAGGHSLASFFVDKGYEFLINKADWLWRILYQFSKLKPVARLENFLLTLGMRRAMEAHFAEGAPSAVVATYFLVGPLLALFKKHAVIVPITVVVTDWFTVHPMWFHYPALMYLVFSQEVRLQALKAGVPSSHITVVSPIINEKFFVVPPAQHIERFRNEHALSAGIKTILVVGGGNGLPHGEQVLENLIQSDITAQYIVVCGHDKMWQKKAEALAARTKQKVAVFGFVDFMHTLIALADVVVTKAGPAMIMETIILKKPLVLTHYIWEQEKGNMQFVVDKKIGFYEPNTQLVPALVKKVLFDEYTKKMLAENCSHVNLRSGTAEIVDEIFKNLKSKSV